MESLQGHLLIATPRLLDPNFLRTVILMVQHDENGALGLVLNRLRRDTQVKHSILDNLRQLYAGIEDYDVAVEGGTVQVFFHECDCVVAG